MTPSEAAPNGGTVFRLGRRDYVLYPELARAMAEAVEVSRGSARRVVFVIDVAVYSDGARVGFAIVEGPRGRVLEAARAIVAAL